VNFNFNKIDNLYSRPSRINISFYVFSFSLNVARIFSI